MKVIEFLSENFQFLVMKFSVYLNRHVFVMHVEDLTVTSCLDIQMRLAAF